MPEDPRHIEPRTATLCTSGLMAARRGLAGSSWRGAPGGVPRPVALPASEAVTLMDSALRDAKQEHDFNQLAQCAKKALATLILPQSGAATMAVGMLTME